MNDLKIEKQYADRLSTTILVEGFSPEEMNEILNPKKHDDGRNALCDLLEKHGYGSTAKSWHNGYGIYDIRHFGGHLIVKIGNNCD